MTEPSVETVEERALLRQDLDEDGVSGNEARRLLKGALDALDARDAALAEARAAEQAARADQEHQVEMMAELVRQHGDDLAEARAAERERCINRVEQLYIDSGGEILCGDTLDAAIRALRDPGA